MQNRLKWLVALFGAALLFFLAYEFHHVTALSMALRDREATVLRRENQVLAALVQLKNVKEPDVHHDDPIDAATDPSATVDCPRAPRTLQPHQDRIGDLACSGHGLCNVTIGRCLCGKGFAGYACETDLGVLGLYAQFESNRQRELAAAQSPSKSGPSDEDENQLLTAQAASKLVTVVIPLVGAAAEDLGYVVQLVASVVMYYQPFLHMVITVPDQGAATRVAKLFVGKPFSNMPELYHNLHVVVASSAEKKEGLLAAAWTAAVREVQRWPTFKRPPFLFFLAPDVVRFHENTNLQLALSLLLTTNVDVLGMHTLAPLTDNATAPVDSGAGEYLFVSECWKVRYKQWMLRFEKPPFGYERHEKYVAYCDRVGNSFIARTSFFLSASAAGSFFNETMNDLVVVDFFLRIYASNNDLVTLHARGKDEGMASRARLSPTRLPGYTMVGVCSECLLISSIPVADTVTGSERFSESFGRWKGHIIPPPVLERLHVKFAEHWQVEALFPPNRFQRDASVFKTQQAPFAAGKKTSLKFLSAPGQHGRLVCVKSGGIYGHSNRGLFAPLCHRYERQRDFTYLASLWVDPAQFNPSHSSQKMRRYGVSLHHGNLFGALRMGQELLWETDGDIDFISFDDTHEEMMQRWDQFLQFAVNNAGFEMKMTYPEKPWYVSLLRDKTDFQVNCRGVKSSFTRGRPPQVHNVSIWYQGARCYVNGFQNPWRSIRSDPGHDYRQQYLAQQGWVLNFAKKSIECVATSGREGALMDRHNACLPSCNEGHRLADHNYCSMDETNFDDWRDLQPLLLA